MTAHTNTISIDISVYESQLRGEIASDLTGLKTTLDAIAQPDFRKTKYILKQNFVISEISVPPPEFLERREINKCFKSIVGSLQDYMDKLIAVLRLKSEPITLTLPTTQEQVREYMNEKFQKHLLDVSTDRSLTSLKKLGILLDKSEHKVYKESIQSYFEIRNGLEHHKGRAKADRIIRYRRIGLASTAGYEVKQPGPLGENEGLVMTTFDEEIKFDKGGLMLITKDQLESIILNLLIFCIPTIQTATGEKFST